jgi:hypothetical protein
MKRIRIHGIANMWLYEDPMWLKSYCDTPDGRGHCELTAEIAEAMIFPTAAEAMRFWQQQSAAVPLRPDGKPNRPLSAYTVEIC